MAKKIEKKVTKKKVAKKKVSKKVSKKPAKKKVVKKVESAENSAKIESASDCRNKLTNAQKIELCQPIKAFISQRVESIEKIAKEMAAEHGFDIELNVFMYPKDFSDKQE